MKKLLSLLTFLVVECKKSVTNDFIYIVGVARIPHKLKFFVRLELMVNLGTA